MRKKILSTIFVLMLVLSLWADGNSIGSQRRYSYSNRVPSPFRSASYYGEFFDLFTNPAALPLIEDNQGSFMLSMNLSDNLPFSSFSNPVGYINEQIDEMTLSFVGRNIALTANIGTSFANKRIDRDRAFFDIYSNMDIEIDWGFSFPYVSFGLSIEGGNSLIRSDKPIDDVFDAIANALFSPFDRNSGSERFSLGAGVLIYFDNFSIGLNIEDILTLNERNEISSTWRRIGQTSDLSFSAKGDKFTKNGDLQFLLPRVSLSFSEFLDDKYTFSVKGDLTLQFLPDANVSLGVGYREYNHSLFSFDSNNGIFDAYIKGSFNSMSITLGASFDCDSWSNIAPVIGFSYTV